MSSISRKGIAVITGASSGLGEVYADRLAKRGYDVKLVARRREKLDVIAQRLQKKYGVNAEVVVADLERPTDLEQLAKSIETESHISVLVNNAGTSTFSPLAAHSADKSASMIAINITALTRLTHAALVGFKNRNDGILINIGSVLGHFVLPFSSVYSGTKAYVVNFTRGLQQEFAETKVRIQLVNPASTATEIWDVAGVPLSALDQATIMTAENCVDAALAGLDLGELVSTPPLENLGFWTEFDSARERLFAATQTGKPASRYKLSK